ATGPATDGAASAPSASPAAGHLISAAAASRTATARAPRTPSAAGAEHAVGDQKRCRRYVESARNLSVEAVEIRLVDVDLRLAVGPEVDLAAENREVLRQAPLQNAVGVVERQACRAVVLFRIE